MKAAFFKWMGLNNRLTTKIYDGYGHAHRLVIHGHVFSYSPDPRLQYVGNFFANLFSIIRLFFVKPVPNAHLRLRWREIAVDSFTGPDGFFRMQWSTEVKLEFGWHQLEIDLLDGNGQLISTTEGRFFVPHSTQYGFISDIDDTFLVSHSATILKRLYVLFTHNARSRRVFDDVVEHYRHLALAHTTPAEPNPFFYVSSSEWNLYDYIKEFCRQNKMPDGVFLLNTVKQWFQVFKTGKTKHAGKFTRIVRIMEAFPNQRFILLGDSSQRDPYIYQSVVKHFPGRIHAVYIRDVHKKNRVKVSETLLTLEEHGVACCFFDNSTDAIAHSRKIALLGKENHKIS